MGFSKMLSLLSSHAVSGLYTHQQAYFKFVLQIILLWIIKHIYVACGFFRVFCAYIIKFVFTVISIVKVAVMCYVKCVICLLRHLRCTI